MVQILFQRKLFIAQLSLLCEDIGFRHGSNLNNSGWSFKRCDDSAPEDKISYGDKRLDTCQRLKFKAT